MESITSTNTGMGIADDEKAAADAVARIQSDLTALKVDELLQVNLDVQAAAQTILGALPKVRALRDRMVKELPAFDVAQFDKLEDYTLALTSAQAQVRTAALPPDDLQALFEEGSALRERLLNDAKALAGHKLFDARKIEQLKGANGYGNVAQDLQTLSTAMRESWATIQGKSPTAAEDLVAADRIATKLTRTVGVRAQSPEQLASATDLRLRAFNLVLSTYEEARHAVGYLRRREDDADSIVPSLYPGKGKRRPAEPDAPTPPATTPATGTTTAPAGSTTAQMPAVTPAAAAAALASQKAAPASKDPFIS